jgi:hypothetical protein
MQSQLSMGLQSFDPIEKGNRRQAPRLTAQKSPGLADDQVRRKSSFGRSQVADHRQRIAVMTVTG